MRLGNIGRASTECPAGSLYYVCEASNYSGCCMLNACHYDDGCPFGESAAPIDDTTTATSSTAASLSIKVSTSLMTIQPIYTDQTANVITALKTTTITTRAGITTTTPLSSTASTAASTEASTASSTAASITTTSEKASTTDSTTDSTAVSTTDSTVASTTGTNTADRVSGTAATASASATLTPVPQHQRFPPGAIGGIVAGVVVLLAVIAFLLVRRRQRLARKMNEDASNGSDERMLSGEHDNSAGAGAGIQGGLAPTVSPLGEKGIFKSVTPLSAASTPALGGSDSFAKGPAEMIGSPANSAVLFGELPGSEATAAAYAARAKAGSYPLISELDGTSPPPRVELETPQSTPGPTPLSTPSIGANSPNLSQVSSSHGGRSTGVSSWRASGRTVGGDTIVEGLEQQGVPAPYRSPGKVGPVNQANQAMPAVSESPRPNLELSQAERGNGVHVASWTAYQG